MNSNVNIQGIKDELLTAGKMLYDEAHYCQHTTFKHVPKSEDIKDDEALESITQYAMKIVEEEARLQSMQKNYIALKEKGFQQLYSIPEGSVATQVATKTIELVEAQDKEIKEIMQSCQTRLQNRYDELSKISNQKLQKPLATYKVNLTPATNLSHFQREVETSKINVNTGSVNRPSLAPRHTEIPKFYGDFSKWTAFNLIFKKAVVDNDQMDPVDKHNTLKNQLGGKALHLIKPYVEDGNSFKEAYECLENYYGDKEIQYEELWNRLIGLKEPQNKPSQLRTLHTEIHAIINSLKIYDAKQVEQPNYQTTIKQKIPEEVLEDVLALNPTNTTELIEKFGIVVKNKEKAARAHKNNDDHEERTILVAKNKTPQNIQTPQCKFCSKRNHKSIDCRTISTIAERKKFIQMNNLCYKCLKQGHQTRECRNKNCGKCNGLHHAAICTRQVKPNEFKPGQNQASNFRNYSNQRQNYNPRQGNQAWNQNKGQYNANQNRNNQYNANQNKSNQYTANRPQNVNFQRNIRTQPTARNPQWNNGQRVKPFHVTAEEYSEEEQYQGQMTNPNNQGQQTPQQVRNYSVRTTTNLMIADAPILIANEIENIPVLLDSGADQSFILQDYAEEKNLPILVRNIPINIGVFSNKETHKLANLVEFELVTTMKTIKIEALTIEELTDLFEPIELTTEDVAFLEKENFETTNITKPKAPVALIGCDVFWDLISNEEKIQIPSGRYMIKTHIGNLICGKKSREIATHTHALITRISEDITENTSESNFQEHFELSNIGITEEITDPTNEEIIAEIQRTVEKNPANNKMIVSLPWKPQQREKLANNLEVAHCRLTQQFHAIYGKDAWNNLVENFNNMEKMGLIEEIDNDPTTGYYIPFQLVFNSSSNTTKVRTVFDASSKKRGEISLNNALHQGPSLIPELQGILLRIRKGSYIMSGDIEKAFHMVEVNPKDRDAIRFTWLKDPSLPPSNENTRYMRFTVLPFGVNSSPFLLAMAITLGILNSNASPELKETITKMCYVDNVFVATDKPEKLKEIYEESKKCFKSIGMNIREFTTNYPKNIFNEEDKTKNPENVKILGYIYDLANDTLEVKKPKLEIDKTKPLRMTKRKVVSEITTIFDPLQYHAPLYLEGKMIMKEIADNNIKWNHLVSNEIIQRTIKYREKISKSILKFRRKAMDESTPIHLTVFTDASETTYGCCVYTKTERENGQFETHLLIAKQRLAPRLKTITIPKMELLGILIGTRLLKNTIKEIEPNLITIEIFTDSSIALAQIINHSTPKGDKQPVFIENRCREIWTTLQNLRSQHKNCEISLSHVPTEDNPADHITRGSNSEKELMETNWYKGPIWLQYNTHPKNPSKKEGNKFLIPMPQEEINSKKVMIAKTTEKPDEENKVFEIQRINDFGKIRRIAVYVLRFIHNRIAKKLREENREKLEENIPEMNVYRRTETFRTKQIIPGKSEIRWAENLLIRLHQKIYNIHEDPKENRFIADPTGKQKTDRIIYQFFRSDTRASVPVLRAKSDLGKLIIRSYHEKNLHAGPATILGEILRWYAGTGWRKAVKDELKKCITCRKKNNHRFPEAPPGQIPKRRITPSRPFQHIGIDFMGPIRTQKSTTSEIESAHIALFTCAASRLLHLEVVYSLKTDEFLLALSRFMSRRGYPDSITTDNAATFVLTAKIMKECSRKEHPLTTIELETIENEEQKEEKRKINEIQEQLGELGIQWYFNTALAPWQGGFYERFVGITKKALKHALGDHQYLNKDLETIVIKCESIVNNRPLTYIDNDTENFSIIRPIDLITPQFTQPEFDEDLLEEEYETYTSRFRQTLAHVKRFWKVIQRDYFNQAKIFRTAPQNNRAASNLVKPVIGEVVLLVDEQTPREKWKMGIITKLIEGRDGEIRSVHVKTNQKRKRINGKLPYVPGKTITITRPLRLLIPLELRPNQEKENKVTEEKKIIEVNEPEQPEKTPTERKVNYSRYSRPTFLKSSLLMILMCILTALLQTAGAAHALPRNPSSLLHQNTQFTFPQTTEAHTTTRAPTTTSWTNPTNVPTTRTPPTSTATTTTTKPVTVTPITIPVTTITTPQTVPTTTRTVTTTEAKAQTTTKATTTPTRQTTPTQQTTTVRVTTSESTPTTTTIESSEEAENRQTPHTLAPKGPMDGPKILVENRQGDYPRIRDDRKAPSPNHHRVLQDAAQNEARTTTETQPDDTTEMKSETVEENDEIHTHPSESIIECTELGVKLIDKEHLANSSSSVCTEGWCADSLALVNATTEIEIPPEFTTHKHKVYWKKNANGKYAILEKTCPAQQFCKKLEKAHDNCVFCSRFLFNTQCHPKFTVFIVLLILSIPIKILMGCWHRKKISNFCEALMCWRKREQNPESVEMRPLRVNIATAEIDDRKSLRERMRERVRNRIRKNNRQNRNRSTILESPRTRTYEIKTVMEEGKEVTQIAKTGSRTPTPPSTLIAIATIIALVTAAAADLCDKTIPITHEEVRCDTDGKCVINKIEDVFFTPETKTICIHVVAKNQVLAKFKLGVEYNLRKCEKGPITFTKNSTVKVDSSKRCHGMGECVDRKCLDIGPNSKLVEFPEANKYPGNTYCTTSCGSIWCKCLLPTPACLFYRTYAVPTSDEQFQIYTCESWTNKIAFQATTTVSNSTKTESFVLRQGDTKKLAYNSDKLKIEINLIEISDETGLSVLGKKFIQNKEKIALASITNEIFPLECDETGKCNYRETCSCAAAEEEVTCGCKTPDLYKIIEDKDHHLPIITERYHLGTTIDNIPAIRMKHSKLHFQLSLEKRYDLHTVESKIDCAISKHTEYIGCYNCLKGATQNITCESAEPSHAKLTCNGNEFIEILTCDKKGIVNEIHRQFNSSTPSGTCTVSCGSKTHSYIAEGKLTYVGHSSAIEYFNQVLNSEKKLNDIHPWVLPDVWSMWDSVQRGAIALIIGIAVMLTTALLLYICCLPTITRILLGFRAI